MTAGEYRPLEQVCEVEYGTRVVRTRDGGSVYPVYGGGGETFAMDEFNRENRLVVSRFGMSERCTRFVSGRFFLNDSGLTLSPKISELTQRFLDYQLLSLNDDIFALGKGSAQKNLDVPAFRTLVLFVPDRIEDQQRIVGILDEAFEGIATAKANAERNVANARALYDNQLQSVFRLRGPGWTDEAFGELIESNIIGLTKNSDAQSKDKEYPYVKMNNITRNNRFDFSRLTSVDATTAEVDKYSLRDGDFLFNTRNSHELVGKSCIYESKSADVVLYNNNIMRVRFRRGIEAEFVLLAFSSSMVADSLHALKSGTTNVSAIYFKDLKSLGIPVAPVDAQREIVAKLALLLTDINRLSRLYEQKLEALNSLKKSLLHQAFTGQL